MVPSLFSNSTNYLGSYEDPYHIHLRLDGGNYSLSNNTINFQRILSHYRVMIKMPNIIRRSILISRLLNLISEFSFYKTTVLIINWLPNILTPSHSYLFFLNPYVFIVFICSIFFLVLLCGDIMMFLIAVISFTSPKSFGYIMTSIALLSHSISHFDNDFDRFESSIKILSRKHKIMHFFIVLCNFLNRKKMPTSY
jgi:hypothetical protein